MMTNGMLVDEIDEVVGSMIFSSSTAYRDEITRWKTDLRSEVLEQEALQLVQSMWQNLDSYKLLDSAFMSKDEFAASIATASESSSENTFRISTLTKVDQAYRSNCRKLGLESSFHNKWLAHI
jgi:hypothetical protein